MKKVLRYVSGIGLVILGIIGLILPIMPGWIFLVPGLTILSKELPWLDKLLTRWLSWAREKYEREVQARKKPDPDSPPPAV